MTETIPDKVEAKGNFRELVFENITKDEENLSLMIHDSAPKGVKPFADKNYYKIPLYNARSVAHDSDQADIELVHICPKRYAQVGNNIIDHQHWLRDGYLYVNGYLWRELQVAYNPTSKTVRYSDVNLRVQKGEQRWKQTPGEREATGEALTCFLVPYKLQGQECTVEVAYSEVQWSWRQVQAFGGMNPQDPRLTGHEPVKTDEADRGEAAQRRAERMTLLDGLSHYQQGYSNQQQPKHLTLPFNDPTGVYTPIIDDEIGRARGAAKEISVARKALELLQVSSALEAPLVTDNNIPKPTKEQAAKQVIAQTIQNQFFAFPQTVQRKVSAMGESNVNEAELELAADYKKWAEESLKIADLRRYLNTEEALKLAEFINEIKTKSFDLITSEDEVGSFYQAMADYAYFKDKRKLEIYEVITDVLAPLKDNTTDLIQHVVISDADQAKVAELDQQDMGQETILKVIGTHPEGLEDSSKQLKLVKLLFPKQTGDGLSDYESYADPNAPYDITFNVDDFTRANQAQGTIGNPELQLARRGMQVVWGFLNIVMEVPTTMFTMNQHNQPLQTSYAKLQEKEDDLKIKSKTLEKKSKALEAEIKNKQAEIKEVEANQEAMRADLRARGLDTQQIDAQLTHIITQRQQELAALQQEAQQAKNANIRNRQHVANLVSGAKYYLGDKGTIKFRDLAIRNDPYVKFRNLADLVTDGLITEIEIDVNDYFSGKLPEGKIPLNFANRVQRAEQKLNKFNQLSGDFDQAISAEHATPSAKVKINDQHSIQTRLDHLVNLDGSLHELEQMIDQQVLAAEQGQKGLRRKLLVIDGTRLAELDITIDQHIDEVGDVKKEKFIANWDSMTYQAQREALSTYHQFNLDPKTFDNAFKVMLPFVATLEVCNFYETFKGQEEWGINQYSAIFDLADLMVSIGRNIVEYKVGLPTSKQVQVFIYSKGMPTNSAQTRILGFSVSKLALKVLLVIASDTLSFVASAMSLYCALIEFDKAQKAGNTGLAVGHAIMAVGFASMTAGAGLALAGYANLIGIIATGPFFLVGLVAVLIGTGVVYYFTESAIESWLQACPWGIHPYQNDSANNSSIRASYWLERPDYCLLDLYNVLYSPSVSVTDQSIFMHVEITVNVPKSAPENGLHFSLQWRKLSKFLGVPESDFDEISLKQLAQTSGTWQMFLNRTGWKFTVSYHQLRNALGLKADEKIELKAILNAYPEGQGALLLPNFDTDFSLPVSYYKQGEVPDGFWQSDNREYGHQHLSAISSRTLRLSEKSILTHL